MEALPSRSSLEPRVLAGLLTDLAVSKNFKKGERLYIFANKNGDITLSPNKEVSGYKKLNLEEVMKKSSEIMKGCVDDKVKFQVVNQLRLLALRKVAKYGDNVPAEKMDLLHRIQQMAVEITPLAQAGISPERLGSLHTNLQSATTINRSREGRDGVYYLQNAQGEVKTVVKLVSNPFKCLVADRFFKFIGYQTPSYEAFPRTLPPTSHLPLSGKQVIDEIGKKAQESMRQAALDNPEEKERWKGHEVTCRTQMQQSRYILSMNYLNQRSFSSLQFNEKVELLQTPQFLHALGMMHVFDVCLRNRDRLTAANLENFLVLNPADLKALNKNPQNLLKIITLIDHDFKLSDFDKYVGEAKQELETLVKQPAHLENLVKGLFAQINLIHKDKQDVGKHVDRAAAAQEMHKGILMGLKMLVANFPDPQSLSGIFDLPEGATAQQPLDLKDLWQVIAFAKSLQQVK